MTIWSVTGEYAGDDLTVNVHQWCRVCDPDGKNVWDPWEGRLCHQHNQAAETSVYDLETPTYYCSQGDAGGEPNRAMCDLLHGRST